MSLADFFFLIPVLGLAIVALAHLLCLRCFARMRPFTAYRLAAAIGLAAVAAADLAVGLPAPARLPVWLDRALPDTIAYLALVYTYFHVFNMSETGRRMRLMIELYLAPEGLTEAELLQRYPPEEVVNRRIERLVVSGHVVQENGRLCGIKKTSGLAVKLIRCLKWLTMGRMSEFDAQKK